MNKEERALARILFQKKVLSSDGQAFEDLFTDIMQRANKQFIPVKPQGSIGDRKNDGYDPIKGHYYQVFAPENLRVSKAAAVAKLKTDFHGLKAYWDKNHPIKNFSFVVNDKYKGSLPTIETDLAQIRVDHNLEECGIFLARHLEDVVFSLSDDKIIAIVGFVPDPEKIANVEYSVLNEIISFIRTNRQKISQALVLSAPDFDEKIKFNKINKAVAHLLNTASYQVGAIDQFFELNSEFAKQELRDHLNSLYEKLKGAEKKTIAENINCADLVFFNLLDELVPAPGEAAQTAALVVMAYFFESCDIFEEPKEAIQD